MNRSRLSLTVAGLLTAALALPACSSGDSMSGMDHGSDSSDSSSEASADFNDTDVTFASSMVVHHEQAVEMADIFLEKNDVDERVTALAEKIRAAQKPEIDTMTGWLDSWGVSSESMGGHDMGDTSGSMSEGDMTALTESTGAEANGLFLTQMTAHHTGAVEMANEEIDSGQNPQAVALAETIVTDQTAEIAAMNDLLSTL
ncbi:DUF305 domain-containing protein [Conyzicola sp.]|uniref:DUF305 domain-containing protein n=1 Tax=Conyzicola sp. TaxID=1969404 RepID=UPI003989ED44